MSRRHQTRVVAPVLMALVIGSALIAQQKLADEWLFARGMSR